MNSFTFWKAVAQLILKLERAILNADTDPIRT